MSIRAIQAWADHLPLIELVMCQTNSASDKGASFHLNPELFAHLLYESGKLSAFS